jgi:hypothetical protein
MESERDDRPSGDEPTTVEGISFWQAGSGARARELNTRDELAGGGDVARWVVTPLTGEAGGQPVESTSPQVRGFLGRVIAEKERIVRRTRACVPLLKPAPKGTPSLPPHAPVPCPFCRPRANADHPGEAWPDCELCDGEGVVTAREAAAWREEHG